MDAATSRNGLIAFSAFFVMLFIILTVNSYSQVVNNTPIQSPKVENLQNRALKTNTLDSVTIRHPSETVDESNETIEDPLSYFE